LIFMAAAGLLAWRTNEGASDGPARLFVGLGCAVAASGCVLSLFHRLGSPIGWGIAGISVLSLASGPPGSDGMEPSPDPPPGASGSVGRFATVVLGTTAVVVAIANAILILGTAPGAWDALTYHLPRMALALQSGAYWDGPANFWAQVAQPTYS